MHYFTMAQQCNLKNDDNFLNFHMLSVYIIITVIISCKY